MTSPGPLTVAALLVLLRRAEADLAEALEVERSLRLQLRVARAQRRRGRPRRSAPVPQQRRAPDLEQLPPRPSSRWPS